MDKETAPPNRRVAAYMALHGLTPSAAAEKWEIGETTLRKTLAGQMPARTTTYRAICLDVGIELAEDWPEPTTT